MEVQIPMKTTTLRGIKILGGTEKSYDCLRGEQNVNLKRCRKRTRKMLVGIWRREGQFFTPARKKAPGRGVYTGRTAGKIESE